MADPVILTVDDEPQVRNAVERDLRQKYGVDYRIIKAGSGAEVLDVVRQLKELSPFLDTPARLRSWCVVAR